MKKVTLKIFVVIVVALIIGGTHLLYSTTLLHRNLKELVTIADRVFIGKCISVQGTEVQLSGGKIYATEYTFEVSESLKGSVGDVITFRQYGLSKPKQVGDELMYYGKIPAMPTYNENEAYMLFLGRDSKLGLTSPVGLFQGAFSIQQDNYGRQVAVNGIFNRGLFKDMDASEIQGLNLTQSEQRFVTKTSGPLFLHDFVSVVKKHVKTYK
ncbi:hypothetical protein GWO43_25420 [candidate division KSB1 bacterium]|nr:hypothetical protein [candidate division KSB1 bacterium]NIR68918.1 hypothetical protein [candidate division KSB1 bacterium]NIS27266.1 hypothetical protein [candidate division KSB1 bacterium]NIT74151.1 hypothetical protein [candidate division KSB1 bacterium]NIU28000.1 hypothetical protein [candidate division KSB1 bacterium]